MNTKEYAAMSELFEHGKLEELDTRLKPYIEQDDPDALFLAAHFELDEAVSGEAFDARRVQTLVNLSSRGHARSQYILAWMFRIGDEGLEQCNEKFLLLLGQAALSGDDAAINDFKAQFRIEFNE
ncbi:hypothetical protein O2N63_01380 [Aliiroseovarius sp. KMU-50]|uniref:Co-chaperone DjlA N-terminal domain-containing protein n=1 Tax=Aliiroseovarius salicola TaxID=3009082 RepID=A0ABT4VWX9_9RHOB|nr:hypothetical protein [Aliiroseovarius sp. KMU-50]MDA5092736.1 hypothetical protein [Aliiroseovarius sp. KMU-50]